MATWIDFYNNIVANANRPSVTPRQPVGAGVNRAYEATNVPGVSAARPRVDPNAGNNAFGMNKGSFWDSTAYLIPGLNQAALFKDVFIDQDARNPGQRIMDVLSRGLYTTASGIRESNRQVREEGKEDLLEQDWSKILGAAKEGFVGRSKTTARDIMEDKGSDNAGFWKGVRNFGLDVAMDPLTLVGPGAFTKGKDALRSAKGLIKTAEDATVAGEKAADGKVLVRNPSATAPTAVGKELVQAPRDPKDFKTFVETLKPRSNQVPEGVTIPKQFVDLQGSAPKFDPNTPERTFFGNAGPQFVDESGELSFKPAQMEEARLGLPGASPEVLMARAELGELDELSRAVTQFEYGRAIDELPETGFFQEATARIPVDEAGNALDDAGQARILMQALAQAGMKPADLDRFGKTLMNPNIDPAKRAELMSGAEDYVRQSKEAQVLGDRGIENARPEVKAILSKEDEPVYAKYEAFSELETPIFREETGSRARRFKGVRVAEGAGHAIGTIGDIRRALLWREGQGAVPPLRAKYSPEELRNFLAGHVKAIEEYAKTQAKNYAKPSTSTETKLVNYYKEEYGYDIKKNAPVSLTDEVDELGLPVTKSDKLESIIKYKEITEYKKMSPIDKLIWLHSWTERTGMSEAHAKYLAQAHNQASFKTRLNKLQYMQRAEKTRDVRDLIEGIKTGRIQSVEEAGIPALMERLKAKDLDDLVKKLEKKLGTLSKAEQKMLGRLRDPKMRRTPNAEGVIESNAQLTKQVERPGIKELGPTGEEFKPYTGVARKAEEAKKKAKATPKAQVVVEKAREAEAAVEEVAEAVQQATFNFTHTPKTIFDAALRFAVDSNLIQPKNKALYAYVTKTGVLRTAPKIGEGRGRRYTAWNKFSQYDFWKGMFGTEASIGRTMDKEFKAYAAKKGLREVDIPKARAEFFYNIMMEPMRAMDDFLKAGGIYPTAGLKNGDSKFSLYDALMSVDPAFAKRWVFTMRSVGKGKNARSSSWIAPTQFMDVMDIVQTAARKGDTSPSELEALVRSALLEVQTTNGGAKIPNGMPFLAKTDDALFNDVVQDIILSGEDLAKRVEANEKAHAAWRQGAREGATEDLYDEIARTVTAPDFNIPNALKLANEIDSKMLPRYMANEGGAMDQADVFAVRTNVSAAKPNMGMSEPLQNEAKHAEQMAKAETTAEKTAVGVKKTEESAEAAAMRAAQENGSVDFEDVSEWGFMHRALMDFFPHLGNKELRPRYLHGRGATQTMARTYQSMLGRLSRNHKTEDLMSAWRELQVGTWSTNPQIHKAQEELIKAIGVLFSDDSAYSVFGRNGLRIDTINAHLDHYKVPKQFWIHDDAKAHDIWKQWSTDDPLNLLSQYFAATMRAHSKKMIGDQLMFHFGSRTPKPGWVKVTGNKSELIKYIDAENYYFPRDIISQMAHLDDFMKFEMKQTYPQDFKVAGVDVGKTLRFYDNLLHKYKSGMTIYRPGHHVRNMVGDVWLNYMAGITNPLDYAAGFRIMAAYRGRYRDFDALAALARGDRVASPVGKGSKKNLVEVRVNGKKSMISDEDLYRAAYDRGLLPDYRTLEDVQIGAEGQGRGWADSSNPFKRRAARPLGGKAHQVASTFSEGRDHSIRLTHFHAAVRKAKGKSINEVFDNAAAEVRKWHPDGSDLGIAEQQVMRRTILFYSWIRKAIPLILEGMVMRPGRFMMYPKAVYNMAVANGIDPASLSDPFPMDQLFPDWLTDGGQGPLREDENGNYIGYNPGIPAMDVFADYVSGNPLETVMGSTTPIIKLPFELGAGHYNDNVAIDARTGIPYWDVSDYLDKQVPNSTVFTGSTGRSLTQPWQAKGGADREIKGDPERSLFNFLTGMGMINMSKENYIKQAKAEENAARQGR